MRWGRWWDRWADWLGALFYLLLVSHVDSRGDHQAALGMLGGGTFVVIVHLFHEIRALKEFHTRYSGPAGTEGEVMTPPGSDSGRSVGDLAKDAKRLRRRFRRVEQRIDRIVWNVRRIEERTWYLLEPNITRPEDLHVGDLVIHRQHGLGRYVGTSRQMSDGEELDYLDLEYAEGYKLQLPVVRLDMICRYQGDPRTAVLDTLGG